MRQLWQAWKLLEISAYICFHSVGIKSMYLPRPALTFFKRNKQTKNKAIHALDSGQHRGQRTFYWRVGSLIPSYGFWSSNSGQQAC